MGKRAGDRRRGPKCIALVGPYAAGKTTVFEALLARTGAIPKQHPVGSGNTVADRSPEARDHGMSVEATFATTEFMGETITFVDCPGSVEFAHEAQPILAACDLAIVVGEADEKKIPALNMVFRQLDALGIPRMLFLNKVDRTDRGIRDTLKLLQPASAAPLLLRQIALRRDGIVVGSIDLALERAYIWREHAESEIADIPDDDRAREVEARFSMLETLADHDDELMEQLLGEIEPPRDAVFDDLAADVAAGAVVPVLIGSAEHGNGILRLLKAIRHDCPDIEATRARLGLPADGGTVLRVMKSLHTSHGGKLSLVRVLSGEVTDGMELRTPEGNSVKVSGIYRMIGSDAAKRTGAAAGDTVALGKLDEARTGQMLMAGKTSVGPTGPGEAALPVHAIALRARERKDEAKLSAALHRLLDEDPSLTLVQSQETGETIVSGHGEMHLRVLVERLQGRFQVPVTVARPSVPYRETIRRAATKRGRHKKQSGGHGQFGDVVLEVKPLLRGAGFEFTDTITGGVVPKQYIPSVEAGVRDFIRSGPLGFPMVDLAVNLSDGSYHTVDSSDMAFQMAARLAMKEAVEEAGSVLLEPVMRVTIFTPNDATARVTAMVPQRRGQILGYDARQGWDGWDAVEATIPENELGDLIIELRSVTAGVGTYVARFDHLAELAGRLADEAAQRARAA